MARPVDSQPVMQVAADDLDLTPPRYAGSWLPWVLALLAHALLLLALAWGLAWQHETTSVASAELWSALPPAAAPQTPQEVPAAAPVPPAPPAQPAAPPTPAGESPSADADIATLRRRDEQRRREDEQERREAEKRAAAQHAAAREKRAPDKADSAAKEAAARAREERQQAQLEAERARHLQRILEQAGTGNPQAVGDAARAAAPSASYAGLLVAHIRPNIVFTDTVPGNPRAEVEVRTLPDGTILASRLLKSSGHRAWDDAVLRAIERTARLPRDENGRVPPTLILGFRPQE